MNDENRENYYQQQLQQVLTLATASLSTECQVFRYLRGGVPSQINLVKRLTKKLEKWYHIKVLPPK